MTEFELPTSGIGSNRSANSATTTAHSMCLRREKFMFRENIRNHFD